MKSISSLPLLITIFSLILSSCQTSVQVTATPTISTSIPPTMTPSPRSFVVTTTDDSGIGTLRQALLDAQTGDIITFDSVVFPPKNPVAIKVMSSLPSLTQGYLTVDASNAGVVLDGTLAGRDGTPGIEVESEHNIIKGLQIVHFTGPGIKFNPPARFNFIGGDRTIGFGPLGEGNLISDTSDGIAIWGSDNVIAGNLIGTDGTGLAKLGNRGPGIFLDENASHNTIGPSNVIAYNGTVGGGGVEIRSVNAYTNTITENSIHDNSFAGIYYNISGSTQVSPPTVPVILDFDLASGVVGGIACPGCKVEVLSTSKADGEIYEGSVTADSNESFTLNIGTPFTGPGLTATARNADGSTSMFSSATSGTTRSAHLQEENAFPRSLLVPKTSQGHKDTLIGDTYSGVAVDNMPDSAQLSRHSAWLGYTWIRLTFSEGEWSALQSTGRYSPLSFGDYEDQVIDNLDEAGITILYNLLYFDRDLQAGPGFLRFRNEQEIQAYLDYAQMVVTHFRGRIQYYETWNEPDIMNFGQQSIAVKDYINVIRRLVPVIHAADPQAKIVIGTGSDLRDPQTQSYLMTILKSDIMPLVDGIAIHPMYGSSPDYDQLKQYYYNYSALVQKIKDTASAHGFTGEYFAEEMTWRTSAFTTVYEVWTYTQAVAAKYYARGIVINRGLGLYAGIGGENYDTYPEVVQVVQNLNTILAGVEPTESLPMQIESKAANIRSYSFLLNNGDYLVALWTDGVAVDDDPGIPATFTFPGFSADEVVGYDILHGFEQQLVTDNENGDLIVHDLLVKNYPIFLHFTP